jgi:hypothetical protein
MIAPTAIIIAAAASPPMLERLEAAELLVPLCAPEVGVEVLPPVLDPVVTAADLVVAVLVVEVEVEVDWEEAVWPFAWMVVILVQSDEDGAGCASGVVGCPWLKVEVPYTPGKSPLSPAQVSKLPAE